VNIKRKLFVAGALMAPVLGIGGLAYASTSGAAAGPGTTSATTAAPSSGADTPDAAEPAATAPEPATAPGTDAPGGHQDPSGSNLDHQFQGQE
jgi:hypothetical protein